MFFIKEHTSSIDQFSKDFFEYPPYPLKEMKGNVSFGIIRLGIVGRNLYVFSRLIKGLKSKNKNTFDLLNRYDEAFSNSITELKKTFNEAVFEFNSNSFIGKAFIFIILLMVSPLLLISLIIFIFYKSVKYSRKMSNATLGFYNPVFQGESEIVIQPRNIQKSGYECAHIISHEHIHLMQNYYFPNRHFKENRNCHKKKLNSLLDKKLVGDKFIEYIFSLNEVEARLHEIIYSYYRENKKIPLRYKDFIGLILGAELLGDYAVLFLKEYDDSLVSLDFKKYAVVESMGADHLIDMLVAFAKHETASRFICEVLSVMYGNLIFIYGDSKASCEYMETIPKKDLYFFLYGDI